MSNTTLKIEKKDDIIVYDLPEVVTYINNNMLEDIMKIAKNHFVSAFPESRSDRGGGMTNNSASGWAVRQQPYDHPILVKTGHLRDSIHIEGDCIVSDTAYGEYHNDGTNYLPRREFLGQSDALEDKIAKFIEDKLEKLIG